MENGLIQRDMFRKNNYPTRSLFEDLQTWDRRYLQNAILASTWSKDPNRKVGALAVSQQGIPGPGCFNGFPKGVEDREDRLNDKALKNKLSIHAEVNASIFYPGPTAGCSIYVTHLPCSQCASFIIQSGYRRVITFDPELYNGMFDRWGEDFNLSLELFKEVGVDITMAASYPDSHASLGLPNRLQSDGGCDHSHTRPH